MCAHLTRLAIVVNRGVAVGAEEEMGVGRAEGVDEAAVVTKEHQGRRHLVR
jgi:hypothetical protein